jgi:HEAT repeats
VWSIGAYLREVSDPEALPALEQLTASRFTSVQLGAMDALRKIKHPRSAPVLIQRLDDPNKVIRYQAVITLAETFGKDREFAPSMQQFDQDPERYVSAWKNWLSQQPRDAQPNHPSPNTSPVAPRIKIPPPKREPPNA